MLVRLITDRPLGSYTAAALNDLGIFHLEASPWGLTPDATKAARLARMSAELGSSEGMYNLAMRCRLGDGVGKDLHLAVEWLRNARRLGGLEPVAPAVRRLHVGH